MKKSIIFIFTFLIAFGVQAQTIKVPTKADAAKAQESVKNESNKATAQANIGSLIGQLTNNISENAFTDAFKKNKTGFANKLADIKDAAGAAGALQSLQGGLLPAAMGSGWGKVKDKWLKDVKAASSLKSVAGLVSMLESNIGNSFLKKSWTQARPAWQAGLNALSK